MLRLARARHDQAIVQARWGRDDQNNRAVAKNGHARKYCDVPQLRRHRLDDDLLGVSVKDIVDNSSENLTARLNDNDEPIRAIASPQLKLF